MSINSTGTGVLPYAYFNNTIYFLLGREHKESGWDGSDKWSDFGGSIESDHKLSSTLKEYGEDTYTPRITASIEFWEETMGLFGSSLDTYNQLKKQSNLTEVQNGNYTEYLLKVDYNPYWIELFHNAYKFILSCAKPHPSKIGYMYIPSCPSGFTEKTDIKWIPYADFVKIVNQTDPDYVNYRSDALATFKAVINHPQFSNLLNEASIFKNPEMPIPGAVIEVSKPAPNIEPAVKAEEPISASPVKTINSYESHVVYLNNLLGKEILSKASSMLTYIEDNNKLYYETKTFISGKAQPSGDSFNPTYQSELHWKNNYCPTLDKTLTSKVLGQGSYGETYLIVGPQSKINPNIKTSFVVKSVNSGVDEMQLEGLTLDNPDYATVDDFVPSPKRTDQFTCEVASLAIVNHLAKYSRCYNFPNFYGASKCDTNQITYLYMGFAGRSIANLPDHSPNLDSLIFQGVMGIIAMFQFKLVHGDLDGNNMSFVTLPKTKSPVYRFKNKWYIGTKGDYVLYFIDFGFGFIKDHLESTDRLLKDQVRINNYVNWDNNLKTDSGFLNPSIGASWKAYKGYYVKSPDLEPAAQIRRHLYDFYRLFDYMKQVGLNSKYNEVIKIFMEPMMNPAYFANKCKDQGQSIDEFISDIHEKMLTSLSKNDVCEVFAEKDIIHHNSSVENKIFLGCIDK